MRALCTLLMALILSVTSVTAAVARAEQGALTRLVICSMGAERVVMVDADGEPVEGHAHCPDCLAALSPAPSGPAIGPAAPVVVTVIRTRDHAFDLPAKRALTVQARGPPVAL